MRVRVSTGMCACVFAPLLSACDGEIFVPRIAAFSPVSGAPGTEVTISGEHFDRDGRGYPSSTASLPWRLLLATPSEKWELSVKDARPGELRVIIAEGARSGRFLIADDSGTIAESSGAFEVLAHPTIRIVNNAQYDVVDLRLNGEQVLGSEDVIESGSSALVEVTTGRFRIEYAIGGDRSSAWMRGALRGVDAGVAGTVTDAAIEPFEVIHALTAGASSADWVAELRDPQNRAATYALRFYSDGRWVLFVDDVPQGEGAIGAEQWLPYAPSVRFRLTEGGEPAVFGPPFSKFDLRNGPSHWPLLTYARR